MLKRRFGFDPLAAERLVSVGGSYAFGLRLDGVDGRGLARALIAAGGRSRTAGGLELIEIGDYAVVPQALLDADVNGLGAFDALGRDLSVLAISDRARASLLGEGERMIDQPAYAAAAACLGDDVLAARMVPDKQLLANEQGIDLVAVGVSAKADVLCTIGGTADRAAEVETALRNGLAPTARDPVTGELYGRSIASVEVTLSRSATSRRCAPRSHSPRRLILASCSRRSRPGAWSRSSTERPRARCRELAQNSRTVWRERKNPWPELRFAQRMPLGLAGAGEPVLGDLLAVLQNRGARREDRVARAGVLAGMPAENDDAVAVVHGTALRLRRRRPGVLENVAAGEPAADHAGDVARRRLGRT